MPKYDVGELITALNEAVNKLNILRVKYNDLEKTRDAIQAENEKLQRSLHKIMRTAKNKSTHAWDSHGEYWRIAKAALGEEQ